MNLLQETIDKIIPASSQWRDKAHQRLSNLAIPHWSLGRLMDLAEDLAAMSQTFTPKLEKRVIVTCAGDHGVVEEGVSAFPQDVTPQMVENFVRGGASINALAASASASVVVADFGVAYDLSHLRGKIFDKKVMHGTNNIAKGPAMSREQASKAIEGGIEVALELDADMYGTGEMGIGNTTPSAAICACLTGLEAKDVTGRGTGIDDKALDNKVAVIRRAIDLNQPDCNDGLDVLSKVGGLEIAGIAGVILAAASLRRPVVIDGFISTAAALIAWKIKPECADYMIASHKSVEIGHIKMLELLKKIPLIDLGLRLGEGTGAALAMNIVDASRRVLNDILTFDELAEDVPKDNFNCSSVN